MARPKKVQKVEEVIVPIEPIKEEIVQSKFPYVLKMGGVSVTIVGERIDQYGRMVLVSSDGCTYVG